MEFSDIFWTWLEYFGVLTGFLYLWFEMKQKPVMWIIGGICSVIYVFVFGFARIYADMGFNVYNAVISLYGFIQWRKSLTNGAGITQVQKDDDKIEYVHLNVQQFLRIISTTIFIYGIIFVFLRSFTDSPIPQGDAFTTTLSIVATWMLARRIIEHWIFWIVINVVSIYLYYMRGLYPTMFLYTFYAGAALMGYMIWKKKGVAYAS